MDIDKMIGSCNTCLHHHYKKAKEPLLITDTTSEPWQKVGTDLFHLNGKDYLLEMDY